MPTKFRSGKEKCDLIVYDNDNKYFLLNELTNSHPKYVEPYSNDKGNKPGKRQKAIDQLLSSLTLVKNVPEILDFINLYTNKQCCFFNKQAHAPVTISATVAFNRINTITTTGLQMVNETFAQFDFELWEFSGDQIFTL